MSIVKQAQLGVKALMDAFTGRNKTEPEEYLRSNSRLLDPETFDELPAHVQLWLSDNFGDKGEVLCMENYVNAASNWVKSPKTPVDVITEKLNVHFGTDRTDLSLEERHRVEYDPTKIQLVASCLIITENDNVVGMRHLKHPQMKGILTIPQGHIESVVNILGSTLLEVADINIRKELDEELLITRDGRVVSAKDLKIDFFKVIYNKQHSPNHVFITFVLDCRTDWKNHGLVFRGKEDYNMLELYNIDEVFWMECDFLFVQYMDLYMKYRYLLHSSDLTPLDLIPDDTFLQPKDGSVKELYCEWVEGIDESKLNDGGTSHNE